MWVLMYWGAVQMLRYGMLIFGGIVWVLRFWGALQSAEIWGTVCGIGGWGAVRGVWRFQGAV